MFYTKLNLQSDLSKLPEIELFLDDVMQQFNVKDDFLGIMSVPLQECVKNAMVHGNKCDKNKRVNIEIQCKRSKLQFSVTDEGQGFDYDSFLQKKTEQHQGNGLLLMKMLTEDLSFSKNGSQVSYKVNVPFSLPINRKRINVLRQSQDVVKKAHAEV